MRRTFKGKPLPRVSVLPLAKLTKGYTRILYDLLYRKYNVDVIDLSNRPIRSLLIAISRRSIIHIHWIEHKYTFGMVNHLGRFSKLFVLATMPLFIYFLWVVKLIGCPIVTTLHNVTPHRVLFPRLEKCAFKIVLRMSEIIYVHTNYTKFQAKKLYGVSDEKIVKVYHGNWTHVRKNLYNRAKARQILGIDSGTFVMCFVGRISPDKGLHLLVESLLRDSDIPITLLVAGLPLDKEYFDSVVLKSRCLPSSVRVKYFPYWIPDAFLEILIEACDIGVLPYTKTTTPSTVLLFMSFGKPVIAPALPEVKEFVGADYPLLYNGSNEDLRVAIDKAILERAKLPMIGKKMLEKAYSFDWEATASVMYKDYLELYEKHRNSPE